MTRRERVIKHQTFYQHNRFLRPYTTAHLHTSHCSCTSCKLAPRVARLRATKQTAKPPPRGTQSTNNQDGADDWREDRARSEHARRRATTTCGKEHERPGLDLRLGHVTAHLLRVFRLELLAKARDDLLVRLRLPRQGFDLQVLVLDLLLYLY